MAAKRGNFYLYLAIACFIGISAIFIIDGYMGVYDDLFVTSGERESRVDAEVWMQRETFQSVSVDWGEKAFFHYEVDNRRFSSYTADFEVSVWHSQEKVGDLIAQPLSVAAFGKGQIDWVLDTAEFVPANIPPEQGYEFTVVIERGEIERRLVVKVMSEHYPLEPVPAPPT